MFLKKVLICCCIFFSSFTMYEYDEDLYGQDSDVYQQSNFQALSKLAKPLELEKLKILKISQKNKNFLNHGCFPSESNFSFLLHKPKCWFNNENNYFGIMLTQLDKPVGFIVARLVNITTLYILKIYLTREYRLRGKEEFLMNQVRAYFASLGAPVCKVKIFFSSTDCYLEDALQNTGMINCVTDLQDSPILAYQATLDTANVDKNISQDIKINERHAPYEYTA
ncbi:hypothetical protein H0X48_03705 [Candidatus Dependentiae bacterium]|nr:hypothetical protein [Candidatus Dependentiae bacterium]